MPAVGAASPTTRQVGNGSITGVTWVGHLATKTAHWLAQVAEPVLA